MVIHNLPEGTKLMWDPKANYPGTEKPILYPVTIGHKHPSYKSGGIMRMVRMHSPSNTNYMGPDAEHCRLPTQEELDTLEWPEITLV